MLKIKKIYILIFFIIFILSSCGRDSSAKYDKKVLLIGIDGFTNRLMEESNMTNLPKLMSEGTFNRHAQLTKESPTISASGWATILKGVTPSKHMIMGNSEEEFAHANRQYKTIITDIENRDASIETFVAYDWGKLDHFFIKNNIDILHDYDATYEKDFSEEVDRYIEYEKIIIDKTVQHLKTDESDVTFIYFGGLDEIGHLNGRGREYIEYMGILDGYIGRLLSTVKKRDSYINEHWLVLFATDHGQKEDGTHGEFSEDEMTTLYLVWDNRGAVAKNREIKNGSNVDYFTTIWYHLFDETRTDLDGGIVGYGF